MGINQNTLVQAKQISDTNTGVVTRPLKDFFMDSEMHHEDLQFMIASFKNAQIIEVTAQYTNNNLGFIWTPTEHGDNQLTMGLLENYDDLIDEHFEGDPNSLHSYLLKGGHVTDFQGYDDGLSLEHKVISLSLV